MHNTLNCHQFCIHEWEEALWLISFCYCYQLRLDGMDARPRVCLRQGWQRAVVFVCVYVFFYVLGMGVALFVAVTQVRRGFPRCYFLLTFLFVLASHHMLWLVLPFEGVGPQHNSISPTKHARASSHSKLEVLLLRVSLHVAMFSFQTLYVHAKKPSLPTRADGRWFKMDTLLFSSYVSAYLDLIYQQQFFCCITRIKTASFNMHKEGNRFLIASLKTVWPHAVPWRRAFCADRCSGPWNNVLNNPVLLRRSSRGTCCCL